MGADETGQSVYILHGAEARQWGHSWTTENPLEMANPRLVESAWGAVPGLLLVRFPRPLAEPAVPISRQRALRGVCR